MAYVLLQCLYMTTIFTSIANVLVTTRVRTAFRVLVAGAVSSLVGFVEAHNFTSGSFALVATIGTPVYYAAVSLAEVKFPKLGWLLGLLPQPKKAPVVPAVKSKAVGSKS